MIQTENLKRFGGQPNWLAKRLSPVKKETKRWIALAKAIEQYWETYFDPELTCAKNLISIYMADEEGQEKLLREMAEYYDENLPKEDRPILLALRKLELMQKDMVVPLNACMKRACPNVKAEWKPLQSTEIFRQ
ncbi:MAG: hypothetical protein HQK79_23010 [Desulfobacterales bacterium]|nr:hypothetical protein [Desulfobacterales bacterium]